VSRKIQDRLQTVLNAAVTPACLLAVLVIWPVSNLVRALRAGH
jgi:hypothetical protein